MKTLTTILFLTLTTVAYGQDNEHLEPDSLSSIKLTFETLDSIAVKATNPLTNIYFPNVVSFYSQDGVKLAYYTTDKNRWTSFPLYFSTPTNDFNLVNLDKKGHPELIVKGNILAYGSGGGTGIKGMLIINIDSVPTQILNISYGCWNESFGDRNNSGEGAYTNSYTRQIKIVDTKIIISPLDRKNYAEDTDCSLTNIPSGTYVMDNGRIRKKK